MLQRFCRLWIGTVSKASWTHPEVWDLLQFFSLPLSLPPKDHWETMPPNPPKWERLWEATKTDSKSSRGTALKKIWKVLALLLREISTWFASVSGKLLRDGWVRQHCAGREWTSQHDGSAEERPWERKTCWSFSFFLYFTFQDKVLKSKVSYHIRECVML